MHSREQFLQQLFNYETAQKKAREWNGGPFKSNGAITSSVQPGCLQAALPELGLLVLLVLPLALGLWLC